MTATPDERSTNPPANRLRWGVLSTARIATNKVIPAIQGSEFSEVVAICSRTLEPALHAASALDHPNMAPVGTAYGTYEELLADPNVDAVYNPLPNHLHVPWTIKALEAGKHVLCEKPIALTADEAQRLADVAAAHPDLVVMEAFMYRFHPQWVRAKELVDSGELGDLRGIQSWFSYFTDDPANIRHNAQMGGGALFDVGCYPVSHARWLFDGQPQRVVAAFDIDAEFGVDRLVSAILEFEGGRCDFTASMQTHPYQRANLVFERGRYELEIPFNAPANQTTKAWLSTASGNEEVLFDPCDQYTLQADAFARAVADKSGAPTPLTDAIENMTVLDALVESAQTKRWVELAP